MKPEHRVRVLELATEKGDRGFSTVVAEALQLDLEGQDGREEAVRRDLEMKGSMSGGEADDLLSRIRRIRTTGDDVPW